MLSLSTTRSCTSRLVASSINTKQGTSIAPALEPTMITAVNLDQLSECLTAQSRLMEVATLYFEAIQNPVACHTLGNCFWIAQSTVLGRI